MSERKKPIIVAMIPARMGSQRLPAKNLSLLCGKPLIYYAISAARAAGIFERIVINSEDIRFSEIARRYRVEFYQRPAKLADSSAKSDSVVYDFAKNNPGDILAWVNSISPLQSAEEIKQAVNYFIRQKLDSLITVKNEQVHCLYKGKPVNFSKNEIFARTQELKPVQPFVYSVMVWRMRVFKKTFESKGHALFCGRFGVFAVSKFSSIIIKHKEDLVLAESLLKGLKKIKNYDIKYDRLLRSSQEKETR